MFRQILLIPMFLLSIISFGQGLLSENDLSTIQVNELSNAEIQKIRSEIIGQNLSIEDVRSIALAKGMSSVQFSVLETRLKLKPIEQNSMNGSDSGTEVKSEKHDSNIEKDDNENWVFGSEIFNSKSLSFEPNQSLPTPQNYILGPGDELEVVIYGVQQFSQSTTVDKEGRISLANIGSVSVSGLQFGAALELIKKKAGRIYNTILTNESELSVSIANFKSIQVTLIGVENPGNYTLSSLSTVFNALHVAGGPSENGTYRNIELVRGGEVIKIIDLYDFLLKGDISSNVNLQNDDIVRVPVYEMHVEVNGSVKRPGLFELKEGERWRDLITFCYGFSDDAYRKGFRIRTSTDSERRIETLLASEIDTFDFRSGDIVEVDAILQTFENRVVLSGAVFRPGEYEYLSGMTVSDLINAADGLREDAFKKHAILKRTTTSLEKELVGINLTNDRDLKLSLREEDELIISSVFDLEDEKSVRINGEVLSPGNFPFIEGMSLYDLILQAGSFRESASRKVEISRIIISDEDESESQSELIYVDLDPNFESIAENIKLNSFDIVSIRKMVQYEMSKEISIIGEVKYPGNYTLSANNERIMDVLNRAGGLSKQANSNSVKIIRKVEFQDTSGTTYEKIIIPIDFEKASKKPTSKANITLRKGDQIVIETIILTAGVTGEVNMRTEIPISGGRRAKYYINSSGGFSENARKGKTYVVAANGLAKKVKNFGLFRIYPRPNFGSTIVVPSKPERDSKMNTQEVVALSSVLSSLTGMTIAIISILKP